MDDWVKRNLDQRTLHQVKFLIDNFEVLQASPRDYWELELGKKALQNYYLKRKMLEAAHGDGTK